MSHVLTDLQERCCAALRKAPNGMLNVVNLADAARSNNVAVVSTMRALERKGLAGSIRSDNSQWAALVWFLREQANDKNQ